MLSWARIGLAGSFDGWLVVAVCGLYLARHLFPLSHPALKRQDRLGKDPFAGFGTVVEDITESGYTKNQPILLGAF